MAKLSTINNITQNIQSLSYNDNNISNSYLTTTETFRVSTNKLSRFPYEIIIKILIYTDLQTSLNFSSLCHRFRQIGIPFPFIRKALIDKDLALFKSSSFLEYLYHYYTKPSFINYLINHIHHCSFLFSKEQLKNIYESVKINQYRFGDFSFNNNCCIIRSAEIGDERLFRFFLSQDPYHYPKLLASTCSDYLNLTSIDSIDYSTYSRFSNCSLNTGNESTSLFHSQQNLIQWISPNMNVNNMFYTAYTQNQKSNILPILTCTGKDYCYRCCCRCGLLKVDDQNVGNISYPYLCRCNDDINILGDEENNSSITDEKGNMNNVVLNTTNNNSDNNNLEENHCSIPGCNCYYHKDKEEKRHEHEEENDIIQISRGKHICINTSDKNDRAFCQACANGHIEIVKLLLSITHPRLVNTQAHNNYAIINAASNGHVEVVKLLLSLKGERKVDISANDHAAFVWACCYGHLDVVKELIKEPNINTQAQNNSAFIWACNNGKLEVVKLLLSLKGKLAIDPIAQNNRAIVSACSMGNIQIVEALLKYGENDEGEGVVKVDPTVNNNQAFITACSNGSLEIIKMLLALDGDRAINPIDQNNEAFINACTNGHQEIVELLLSLKGKYEVDPSAQDNKAFVRACSYGNLNIVYLLLSLPLSKGIDPTAQQNLAFINACLCGYYDIVKELLVLSKIDFCCIENDILKRNKIGEKCTSENNISHTVMNHSSSTNSVCPLPSDVECSSCEDIILRPFSVHTQSISNNEKDSDSLYKDSMLNNNDDSNSRKILKPINPNDRDNQAFIEACSYGQEKVVKLLLSLKGQYRVDPSAQNYQALIKAAINGHQNVVRLILSINDDRKINEKEPIETSIRLVNDYNYSQKQNYQTILSYLKDYLTKI